MLATSQNIARQTSFGRHTKDALQAFQNTAIKFCLSNNVFDLAKRTNIACKADPQ